MNAKLKFAISTVVSVCLALIIFVVVLMIAQKNHHTFDLTKDQRYSLSPQSIQVVKDLPQPVEAIAFLMELDMEGRNRATELLEQYRAADSSKFSYRLVDPKRFPLEAEKYDVRQAGSLIVESGNRKGRALSIDETQITNALLSLSDTVTKKVYFLTGHGEIGAFTTNSEKSASGLPNMSKFRADLTEEGYMGADLNLVASKSIPADAAIIVIPGPVTELMPAEQKLLEDWLDKGGRLLLMMELNTADKYDSFLDKYGFKCGDELIIDEMAQLAGTEMVYSIGMQYNQECSAVKDFSLPTLFKLARPVEMGKNVPAGAKITTVVATGPNAFTIKASDLLNKTKMDVTKDSILRTGAMPLVAVGTYPVADANKDKKAEAKDKDGKEDTKEKNPQGRIVVVGDGEFACNELYASAGNRDFVLNLMNWLAESEDKITIRPKENNSQPIMLTEQQATRIKALLVFAIPLAVLITGIINSRRRRA